MLADAPPKPPAKIGALVALGNRDFRLLWLGNFASNTGGWVQKVATAWLIYTITGSALWLGVDAACSGLTAALLLPWGGVLADRMDRRRLLVVTNLVAAGLAGVLAALAFAGDVQVWEILAVSFLSGINTAAMAPASQSLLPRIVPAPLLTGAIALNSVQFNISRIAGPALGGVVLEALGAGWSFTLNALSFLVLVAALHRVRDLAPREQSSRSGAWSSMREGVVFAASRPDVRTMLLMVLAIAFCTAPLISMLPALVSESFGQGAGAYSGLLSSFGVGAVIGASGMALRPPGTVASVRLSGWPGQMMLILLGVVVALTAAAPGVASAGALVVLGGAVMIAMMISLGSALLHATPDAFRGRISSLQALAFRGGQPLGSLAAGAIAANIAVPWAFAACGLLLATFAAIIAVGYSARGVTGRHRS